MFWSKHIPLLAVMQGGECACPKLYSHAASCQSTYTVDSRAITAWQRAFCESANRLKLR